MQLAEQLRASNAPVFPCRVTWDDSKGRYNKQPAVPEGMHWRDAARLNVPGDYTSFGIPVPESVLILDLDSYKPGGTRQAVEAFLGCALPWDAALVQRTISGGEHYAFKAPPYPVKQHGNVGGTHLDLRVGGKGFICSGEGYEQAGVCGVLRLTMANSLPDLPDVCRAHFEDAAPADRTSNPPPDTPDTRQAAEILAFIDPGTQYDGVDGWITTIMALRHQFDNDIDAGHDIAQAWSAGEYWEDGAPHNYDYDAVMHQYYHGVKADRPNQQTITFGSLVHRAKDAGYVPPVRLTIDTAGAFAPTDMVIPLSTGTDELRATILEQAGAPGTLQTLIGQISAARLNEFELPEMVAVLEQALKESGQLNKQTRALIEKYLSPQAGTVDGRYGKNDTENATLFLRSWYPGDTILRSGGEWYTFNGKVWDHKHADGILHELTLAMAPDKPQATHIAAALKYLAGLCHDTVDMAEPLRNKVVFSNGVLDLTTGQLSAHSKDLRTTNMLPYDFEPGAQCVEWLKFLDVAFEGDHECIQLLQEWFGYMVSGSYEFQKILVLVGTKRAGKGTICRVLKGVVGADNYGGGNIAQLIKDPIIHALVHKTVFVDGDVQKNFHVLVRDQLISQLKKISGNDEVMFDRKYLGSASVRLPTRLMLSGNQIPKLFDDSGALGSRLMPLPFDVSFFGREDVTLEDRLLAELPGIAMWALDGLTALRARGRFTVPEASRIEAEDIDAAYSPLSEFIDAVCVFDKAATTPTAQLFDAYEAWARTSQQDTVLTARMFASNFKDATRGRCKASRSYEGGARLRAYIGVRTNTEAVPSIGAPNAFTPAVVSGAG